MQDSNDLHSILRRINRKSYNAYKDIKGSYNLKNCRLFIDHVQGDPFAAPSRLRVRVKNTFPLEAFKNKSREIALRDFLTRAFSKSAKKYAKQNRASGKSGLIKIDTPGPEILERTSVVLTSEFVEARFEAGLPAFGRKIAGDDAIQMLLEEIPMITRNSLFFSAVDEAKLYEHIYVCEDAHALREKLCELGLIAFIANKAILPRESGISQKPLKGAVPFASPRDFEHTINLPNRVISGMGIPEGISLIVGGGYHGKSTLLNAIELGIYNHIPSDGREFVVARKNCVKIRAEDGRSVKDADISPFINDLPQGKDTTRFSSENASGSTSQAANIVEALEAGAGTLLIDEDTSATNFMIRDERMQKLVPKEKEPITPYVDKAKQLYNEHNVSTILVIGGSGAYFDIADTVICMFEYEPYEVTQKAKQIAQHHGKKERGENGFGQIQNRTPLKQSINPYKKDKFKVSATINSIQMGVEKIELSCVEQLADESQTRAIAYALAYAKKYMNLPLKDILEKVMQDINNNSLDILTSQPKGNLAEFRKQELAAALNRSRSLLIKK
ncbi:MAG: ABC-ATPase domain-containing protein [Candidatus Nanoarchaeia archaeon]